MKCPHCLVHFHHEPQSKHLGKDVDGIWDLLIQKCPNPRCGKLIFCLTNHELRELAEGKEVRGAEKRSILVWPKGASRPPVAPDVPNQFAEDYAEACLVLPDSPKASAALSRSCLQNVLREVAKVKHGSLSDEIKQVIDSGQLPSHLVDSIDAIRNIGNFAAHPIKSEKSGEIVPVEPGEAEWNLDVLESLFDFYFVQPAVIKRKRAELNKKLKDAGKKEMK